MLRKWEDLPDFMKSKEVKPYYDILAKKKGTLILKRVFDLTLGSILLILLAIPMLVIAVWIKIDSEGPVLYRQERITTYGKKFKIHKFRTMVNDADSIGSTVTVNGDGRITKAGEKLRKLRLDELPQLFDVLDGNMSFVGTRPEATKYVEQYQPEMNATFLLPAGITSEASIKYKDEAKLLDTSENADTIYIEKVLPEKMKYNLESIKEFGFFKEIRTMVRTVFTVLGKEH